MILHFAQRGFTDARTFIAVIYPPSYFSCFSLSIIRPLVRS